MNNSEILQMLNDLLDVIRQVERSPEARLIDLKNRIYQQQSSLARSRQLFADKPVKQEVDGDVLFA